MTTPAPRLRRHRDASAALGVGIVALVAAWRALTPFGERFRDHLAPNLQDPLFNSYLLAWGSRQIALGLPDFWNAGFFFPEPRVLALSDHLIGPAALAWALGRAGIGILASYNLMLLASFPIAAVTVFALLRRAGLRATSAALGSWAYAFAPYRWMHLEHLPVLWLPALALTLWAWDRLLERPSPLRAASFLAAYAIHFTGGLYLAYMILLPLAAIAWMRREEWLSSLRNPPGRWSLIAASGGAAVVALVAFLPYVEAGARGYRRTPGDMAIWGATLASFLTPSHADRYFPAALDRFYRFENALFPGILMTLAALFLAARCWPRWRERLATLRRPILFAFGLALVALALGLGDLATWTGRESVSVVGLALRIRGYSRPALILGLGALAVFAGMGARAHPRARRLSSRGRLRRALLVQGLLAAALCLPIVAAPLTRVVPGLIGLRVPSRFAALALLAGALGVGAAASVAARRFAPRWRGPAILGLGALLLVPDLMPRPAEWFFVGGQQDPPAVYRELARRGLTGAVVEVPFASGDLRSDLVRMWHSTLHWNPTSAGYSGYEPPRSRELREVAAGGPGALLSRCRSLGFRYVILHLDDLDANNGEVAASWASAVAANGGGLLWADDQSQLLSLGKDSDAGDESARLASQVH